MIKFKKALREEGEPPTFPPEDGFKPLPEWDTWVSTRGRRLALKLQVKKTGSQV